MVKRYILKDDFTEAVDVAAMTAAERHAKEADPIPVIAMLVSLRTETRRLLQQMSQGLSIDEREALGAEQESMERGYLAGVMSLMGEKLPPGLREIWELREKMRAEIVEIDDEGQLLLPAQTVQDGKKRKKVRKPAILQMVEQEPELWMKLKRVLDDLYPEVRQMMGREKDMTQNFDAQLFVKFEPFIRLAGVMGESVTAEEMMDNGMVRKACAEWLMRNFGHTLPQASAFYAHVTEKFRSRPTSVWQVYQARMAVDGL